MTDKEMNKLKDQEPRCLNAITYRLTGIINGARKQERIMAEDPTLVHNVDYYEALELCKSLSDKDLELVKTAHLKAQEAYDAVIDAMISKKLLQLISKL